MIQMRQSFCANKQLFTFCMLYIFKEALLLQDDYLSLRPEVTKYLVHGSTDSNIFYDTFVYLGRVLPYVDTWIFSCHGRKKNGKCSIQCCAKFKYALASHLDLKCNFKHQVSISCFFCRFTKDPEAVEAAEVIMAGGVVDPGMFEPKKNSRGLKRSATDSLGKEKMKCLKLRS